MVIGINDIINSDEFMMFDKIVHTSDTCGISVILVLNTSMHWNSIFLPFDFSIIPPHNFKVRDNPMQFNQSSHNPKTQ